MRSLPVCVLLAGLFASTAAHSAETVGKAERTDLHGEETVIMMAVSVLVLVSALAGIAWSQVESDVSTFVPSDLPVYVSGQRLDPREGGHRVAVSREKGLTIDGVLYLPLWKAAPYVPAVRSDGMHYAADGANRAANAVLEAGGTREAARQAMIDFWQGEFGDSLTVVPTGPWTFDLTYRGQTLGKSVVGIEGYHPEKQEPDNFRFLTSTYHQIVSEIAQGFLVVCGSGYFYWISRADTPAAMESLENVASRARPIRTVNGKAIYETQYLVDGAYGLSSSAVADFVAHARKEPQR